MAQMAQDYFVRPKAGNPFPTNNAWITTTIEDVAKHINNRPEQAKALELLGFTLANDGSELELNFSEEGQPYADPQGDRTALSSEKVKHDVNVRGALQTPLVLPLNMEVDLEPFFEMGVNFMGRINFSDPEGDDHVVPLFGVGTVALDGRHSDAHARFSTDAAAATFQQRVALSYAIACAAGLDERYLSVLESRFNDLNNEFHGNDETLAFTFHCCRASASVRDSFVFFMTSRNYEKASTDTYPPMLKSLLQENRALPEYYYALQKDFTPAELGIERKWWLTRQANVEMPTAAAAVPSYYSPMLMLGVGCVVFTVLAILWHRRRR